MEVICTLDWEATWPVGITPLPVAVCVTLGKWLTLSGSAFPRLEMRIMIVPTFWL